MDKVYENLLVFDFKFVSLLYITHVSVGLMSSE